MSNLLEIRDIIKQVYVKYELFILPVLKFMLAFVTLNSLNGKIGYMGQLNNVGLVLIISLLCSFLSTGVLIFFVAVISLAHMYTLSLEVALVGLCVYLIMYLLFFRFSPKDSAVIVLTALLFNMNIPYVVPVAVGLLCGPASIISMACGVISYYFLEIVALSATNIGTMGEGDALGKLRLIIDTILANKSMVVIIGVFAVAVLVVYFVRRLSVDYAWTIAVIAGALVQIMLLLIGDLLFDVSVPVGGALLGTLLAVAVGKIIEFFRCCLDYNRTEKVQFEDDEYYYYVKAVPKMTVAKAARTVKRINAGSGDVAEEAAAPTRSYSRTVSAGNGTGRTPANGSGANRGTTPGNGVNRTAASTRAGSTGGAPTRTVERSTPRTVVTERTVAPQYDGSRRPAGRGTDLKSSKGVTVGNTSAKSEDNDDSIEYEEL